MLPEQYLPPPARPRADLPHQKLDQWISAGEPLNQSGACNEAVRSSTLTFSREPSTNAGMEPAVEGRQAHKKTANPVYQYEWIQQMV